jgi:hypothetical protein
MINFLLSFGKHPNADFAQPIQPYENPFLFRGVNRTCEHQHNEVTPNTAIDTKKEPIELLLRLVGILRVIDPASPKSASLK